MAVINYTGILELGGYPSYKAIEVYAVYICPKVCPIQVCCKVFWIFINLAVPLTIVNPSRERRLRWFGHVVRSSGAIRTACDIQIDGGQGGPS